MIFLQSLFNNTLLHFKSLEHFRMRYGVDMVNYHESLASSRRSEPIYKLKVALPSYIFIHDTSFIFGVHFLHLCSLTCHNIAIIRQLLCFELIR